jgi:hypothetical protein
VAAATLGLAASVASIAQQTQPLTRGQVRAELIQLEALGYRPWLANDTEYPLDVQRVMAALAAQKAQSSGNSSGYGPSMTGHSNSGQGAAPVPAAP